MELNCLDLSAAPVVARASGRKHDDLRWTELAVYEDRDDISGANYVAEIVGASVVPGDEQRLRRRRFRTVAKALAWDKFDPNSRLFIQLRDQAIDWMSTKARAETDPNRLVGIPLLSLTGEPAAPKRWNGNPFGGDFYGAMHWLYEPLNIAGDELIEAIAEDWDVLPDSVRDAFKRNERPNLQAWADVLVRTMPYFDRDAFHAR